MMKKVMEISRLMPAQVSWTKTLARLFGEGLVGVHDQQGHSTHPARSLVQTDADHLG